jgi:hypothetical protein
MIFFLVCILLSRRIIAPTRGCTPAILMRVGTSMELYRDVRGTALEEPTKRSAKCPLLGRTRSRQVRVESGHHPANEPAPFPINSEALLGCKTREQQAVSNLDTTTTER